jgi:NitT/TauT family transport system ATP-binding protein
MLQPSAGETTVGIDGRDDPAVDARRSAVLSLRGVSKAWPNGAVAVTDVSFDLTRGEFLALVGPSGCGKSTLLRIIAGLESETAGLVARPEDPPGCVFQQPNLLAWRDLERNVELYAELDGVPKQERRALTAEVLELVGLSGFERYLPHELSGGMQMRAALARALVTRPEVMLFDEPFAAVDELLRERLQEEVLRLFQAEEFAGVFITHSVSEAVFLSTRVLVMTQRPGRIAAAIDVPFDYPRSPDLRYAPEFVAIAKQVSGVMRDEIVEEEV